MNAVRGISYRPPPEVRQLLEEFATRTHRNLTQSITHLVLYAIGHIEADEARQRGDRDSARH